MKTKAGDNTRTLSQKIFASHLLSEDPSAELVTLRVDQIVLARAPSQLLRSALAEGIEQSQVELNVAYPPHCIAHSSEPSDKEDLTNGAHQLGFLFAQPGTGFAPAVHLERFSCPARLLLTDEPRLTNTGGAGLLALPASSDELMEALRAGRITLRAPRSVHVHLTGRWLPFVGVRDLSFELLRRGLRELIEEVARQTQAPIVIEFGGPASQALHVQERAVLCSFAERWGAQSALFGSDEKTESFLREQRRSKAYRSLTFEPKAPFERTFTIDLSTVEPLILDGAGQVHPVHKFEGQPVNQVVLGGDSGATLRDFLSVAAFLKSKRIPPEIELLVAPPSRQALEVLARTQTLADLVATGARFIEPDRRVLLGSLYPPQAGGHSLHTSAPPPSHQSLTYLTTSAETLAFSVSQGEVGDPRRFKRQLRVIVPRQLPTDDTWLTRTETSPSSTKRKTARALASELSLSETPLRSVGRKPTTL